MTGTYSDRALDPANPIYAGKIEFRGMTHPGLHEALVDVATFETRRGGSSPSGASRRPFGGHTPPSTCSREIRCGRCRRAYVGTSARGRKGIYHYYVCSTRYRYGTEHCSGERLPKDALEEAVIEQMRNVYADSLPIERALADAAAEDGDPGGDAARRLAGVRQELAGAKRSLNRYCADGA